MTSNKSLRTLQARSLPHSVSLYKIPTKYKRPGFHKSGRNSLSKKLVLNAPFRLISSIHFICLLFANYKYWQNGMKKVIEQYGLEYIDIPFITDIKDPKHPGSAAGIYVNYLELKSLIVMPVYNRPEDTQVYNILKETFPNKAIETIDYNDVALEGGILNCSTWVRRM